MAQQVNWTDGKTYTWDTSQNSFTLGGQKVADTLNKQLIERYNAQGAPDGKLFSSSGVPTGEVFNASQTPDGNVFTGGEADKGESGFDKFKKGLGIAYDIGNLGVNIANRLAGNKIADNRVRTVRDPTAAYDRANADLNREQAGKYQQAEQRDAQIAKGNYRAEADRDAASSARAQYNEKATQTANLGAAGGYLAAKTVVAPEYDQQRARADAAHQRAVQYGADATEEQQDANVARAAADKKDYDVAQINRRNRDALIASMPNFKLQTYATKEGTSTTKKEETPPAEQKSEKLKATTDDYQAAFNKLGGFTNAKPGPRATEQGTQQAYLELSEKFGTNPQTYNTNDPAQRNNAAHKFMEQKRLEDEGIKTDKRGDVVAKDYASAGTSQNSFYFEKGADGKAHPVSKGA